MFENQINPFQNTHMRDTRCSENLYAHQYNAAFNQFKSTLLKGKIFRLQMKVLQRQPFLYDLEAVQAGLLLRGSSYSGIKVVCVNSIIGSEGRTSDFDMKFHPMRKTSRERWVGMAIAYLSRLPLPPIQLIQIGDKYFVRDGHHRVSVSRAFGQIAMDAEVVTWKASPPFPWQPSAVYEKLYSLKSVDLST